MRKLSAYLSSLLLLTAAPVLWSAPVTFNGKTVRFIIDDSALKAFGGSQPTVQGDTLIFSAPSASYRADSLAPSKSVGFKEQAIEFSIEGLAGQTIKSVALRSSGLRSTQGKSVLNNALAFGKLNLKDQFLVNRAVEFEATEASAASWQGSEAIVKDFTSRKLYVSASHNLRAISLDSSGNAAIDAQDGVSFTVTTASANQHDRCLDWTEFFYKNLTNGTPTQSLTGSNSLQCEKTGKKCSNLDGLYYRCWPNAKLCAGTKDGIAYGYDYDEKIIHNLGSLQPFLDLAVSSGF